MWKLPPAIRFFEHVVTCRETTLFTLSRYHWWILSNTLELKSSQTSAGMLLLNTIQVQPQVQRAFWNEQSCLPVTLPNCSGLQTAYTTHSPLQYAGCCWVIVTQILSNIIGASQKCAEKAITYNQPYIYNNTLLHKLHWWVSTPLFSTYSPKPTFHIHIE